MSSSETRQNAISAAISWSGDTHANGKKLERVDEFYGADVFSISAMRQRLPKNIFKKLLRTLELGEALSTDVADIVASAMKDWAIENGATHYTHWFQPLTGSTAEKHDSFIVTDPHGGMHFSLPARGAAPEPQKSDFQVRQEHIASLRTIDKRQHRAYADNMVGGFLARAMGWEHRLLDIPGRGRQRPVARARASGRQGRGR